MAVEQPQEMNAVEVRGSGVDAQSFKDGTLALLHEAGPPLVGKVTQADPDKFVFTPPGAGDKTPGLTFTR